MRRSLDRPSSSTGSAKSASQAASHGQRSTVTCNRPGSPHVFISNRPKVPVSIPCAVAGSGRSVRREPPRTDCAASDRVPHPHSQSSRGYRSASRPAGASPHPDRPQNHASELTVAAGHAHELAPDEAHPEVVAAYALLALGRTEDGIEHARDAVAPSLTTSRPSPYSRAYLARRGPMVMPRRSRSKRSSLSR